MSGDTQPKLYEIRPDKDRIEALKKELLWAAENAIGELGDDIGGYALVSWSMGGRCVTTYNCNYGLVHRGIAPTLAHDALQRHIVLDMADEGNIPRTPAG